MIKLKGSEKGEIDLIGVGKATVGLLILVATFYLSNTDLVNGVMQDYLSSNAIKAIGILATLILYIREQSKHDYSK